MRVAVHISIKFLQNVFLQFNDKLKNNMCVFENESNQVLSLMTHPVVVSLKPLQKGLVD